MKKTAKKTAMPVKKTILMMAVFLFVNVIFQFPCRAASSLAEVLHELEQKHQTLLSLSAEFTQGRKDPLDQKPVLSSGKIWLLKAASSPAQSSKWSIRLEMTEPEPLVYLFRDEQMIVFDPKTHAQQPIAQALPIQDHLPIAFYTAKSMRFDHFQSATGEDVKKFFEPTGVNPIKTKGIWLVMKDPLFSSQQVQLLRLHEKLKVPDCFLWLDAARIQHWVEMKKLRVNEPIEAQVFASETTAFHPTSP